MTEGKLRQEASLVPGSFPAPGDPGSSVCDTAKCQSISVLPLFVCSGGYVCRCTKDIKSGCFVESEILQLFNATCILFFLICFDVFCALKSSL